MSFIISAESPMDLSYEYTKKRNVKFIRYNYTIDGIEYEDDLGENPDSLKKFYEKIDAGSIPHTSQINEFRYMEYFENLIKDNDNILHINFGSGMTPSVNNAISARDEVIKRYPDKKILIIDSTCSSAGYGLLVDIACDMRDEGKSLDEIYAYLERICHNIQHQFFSTNLSYFRRSGRISGATATIGTLLGICPIMRLDYDGKIVSYSKAHGIKNTIKKTIEEMKKHTSTDYRGKIFISNSDCLDLAERTKNEIKKVFTKASEITIYNIGTVIASHTGRGTVAVFFLGDKRYNDTKN